MILFQLLPLFYFLIGAIWLGKVIGARGLIYLLAQPVLIFTVHQLGSDKLIYIVALGYKVLEDMGPAKMLETWAFEQSDHRTRYIGSVTQSWINSRCMSFSLDVLWGDVESKGLIVDLIKMLAHSFYLPVAIGGPIIRFKEFNDGVS
jgi:D-alanyl-lipoteichoic acid acyltransferase DltB (MBOAT superfamily)